MPKLTPAERQSIIDSLRRDWPQEDDRVPDDIVQTFYDNVLDVYELNPAYCIKTAKEGTQKERMRAKLEVNRTLKEISDASK